MIEKSNVTQPQGESEGNVKSQNALSFRAPLSDEWLALEPSVIPEVDSEKQQRAEESARAARERCDLHPMDWRESPISVMFVGTEEGTLDVQTATQFFG